MPDYELRLCASAADLRAAHDVRLEVFHKEQGFPAETEVDEYDPVSAHFIVVKRATSEPVGVIRLTPYPREEVLALAPSNTSAKSFDTPSDNLKGGIFHGGAMKAEEAKQSSKDDNAIPQEDTSIVTSGGGPGGTSGGLPMFPSSKTKEATNKENDSAAIEAREKKQADKDEQAQDVVGQSGMSAIGFMPSDEETESSYPLGGVQSPGALSDLFRRVALGPSPPHAQSRTDSQAHAYRGAKVSRLAVLSSERGKHLGEHAVRGAEAWLVSILSEAPVQEGATKTDSRTNSIDIVLSSQMHAVEFYKKLSYQSVGDEYDEEGAPHMWCAKKLAF